LDHHYLQNCRRCLRALYDDFCSKLHKASFILKLVGVLAVIGYTTVAFLQWRTLRQQLVTSDRPWIGVGAVTVTRALSHTVAMQISIHLENVGKSPALHVTPHGVLLKVEPGETPEGILKKRVPVCSNPKPRWSNTVGGALYLPGPPGGSLSLVSGPMSDSEADFLNGMPATISQPSLGLWAVGCVDYFDAFQQAHRTYFCEFLMGEPQRFFFCADGNNAD
jgi:hypothetical protein